MSSEAHVVPLGDLIEHEVTDDCPCGPRQELIRCADGGDGWLVIHNSLDGREAREREDAATREAG